MKIYNAEDSLPEQKRIIALGNFDGVHLGHQAIIKNAVELANKSDALASILLFEPHPMALLQPNQVHPLLTSLEAKIEYFTRLGLDELIIHPFTEEIKSMSPQQFFFQILCQKLNAGGFSIGFDYTFGHQHKGNASLLREFSLAKNLPIVIQKEVLFDGEPVSSTEIKKAIRSGRFDRANRLLGRQYCLPIEDFLKEEDVYRLDFNQQAVLPEAGEFSVSLCQANNLLDQKGLLFLEEGRVKLKIKEELCRQKKYLLFFQNQ